MDSSDGNVTEEERFVEKYNTNSSIVIQLVNYYY